LLFYAAIFFTFGTFGFIQDTWTVSTLYPWAVVAVTIAYSGLAAVGYAAVSGRFRVLLPMVFAFHMLTPKYVIKPMMAPFDAAVKAIPARAPDPHAITLRLQRDGLGAIVFIVLGYVFFIRFFSREGTRHLRLRTEVALAERIHSTLVPPVALDTPRFELFGRSEPSSEVGGDLLDVAPLAGGLVICVADVSGHGVSAGSFMGMVKSAFRMKLLSSGELSALFDDLNAVICQLRSPGMFVTIAALRFDATNRAELGLAGHLPILHFRGAEGALDTIANEHPPLGVVEHERHRTRREAFESGDLFVVLTDGLTEVANRRGEQFGIRGVEEVVRRQLRQPLPEIYASLIAAVRAHGPQTDDQTLLLVRAR
jgi:serine phosphatase RsbU (regulator of sigma subunit)